MIASRRVLRHAIVSVEARTPLSIGGAGQDGTFDTVLVRDANGLPVIPGSSLAGVLRGLWRFHSDGQRELAVFGTSEGGSGAVPGLRDQSPGGRASQVELGWAHVHDATDLPCIGRRIATLPSSDEDPVLAWLLDQERRQPVARNRVRLTSRGTAAEGGHFDRRVVLAGTRFSFELALWSDGTDEAVAQADWKLLLSLLRSPMFRVGGAVRSGLGALELIRLQETKFDLQSKEGFAAFSLDADRMQTLRPPRGATLRKAADIEPPTSALEIIRLDLETRDFLRIGEGLGPIGPGHNRRSPDMTFVTEHRWNWTSAGPEMERCIVISATAIKGPLRHRVAFHSARLSGRWADPTGPVQLTSADDDVCVKALFGEVKSRDEGRAGRIMIDDIFIPVERLARNAQTFTHNSIDRFTGGVRDGVLFQEEAVAGLKIPLRLHIMPGADALARQALDEALADLATGWLQIGAASSRGFGGLRRRA